MTKKKKGNNFDVAMKDILLNLIQNDIFNKLTGLNLNLKKLELTQTNLQLPTEVRADFAVLCEGNDLVQIEVQAFNDALIPARMFLYYAVYLKYLYKIHKENIKITQIILYIGHKKLNMKDKLVIPPAVNFKYKIIDFSKLDSNLFLDSSDLKIKLLTILTKDGLTNDILFKILQAINNETNKQLREEAKDLLTTLANLRTYAILKIEEIIEVNNMTLKINAKETDLYRMGSVDGEARGEVRGEARGEVRGEARGEARERAQIIKTLYLKKKLEISQIAELLELPETDVQEIINQINKSVNK